MISYSIVDAPMRLPEEADGALWEALDRDERLAIHDEIANDPAAAVARLEPLLERYPSAPNLLNWLAVAYSNLGRDDKAEELTRLNYERNPRYLFARANWAEFCLRRGDLDAVKEIFEDKFDLKLLYPHRDEFHVSELIAFAAVAVPYMVRTGNRDAAKSLFEVPEQVAPDHPATESVRAAFGRSILARALDRIRGQLAGQAAREAKRQATRHASGPAAAAPDAESATSAYRQS